ncbi:MAG: DUF4430 domain-containing protein [Candidatus Thorarchaeota archaeon]
MRWKIGMMVLIAMLCIHPGSASTTQSQPAIPSSSGLTLIIDFGNGTALTYENIEGENVLDATNATVEVEQDWYGDSAYVISIAGVSSDEDAGLWWQYWVNDALGPTAANKYEVEDGDIIEWRRIASQTETDPAPNYDFLLSVSVLALLGIGFLAVLFIKMR